MMKTKNSYILFTDGSSRGNPGPGGYGAIIYDVTGELVMEIGGAEKDTTNNRMELRGIIEALLMVRKMKKSNSTIEIVIHTDSMYAINGITKWVSGWEKNNWMTGQKEGVQNQDLWQVLLELTRELSRDSSLRWEKVSGHRGVPGNERVDAIATAFADKKSILLFSGTVVEYETMIGGSLMATTPTKPKKAGKKKNVGPGYSYVSFVNGKIHIDKTWAACEKRVKGKKGAQYKKAMNAQEEKELIAVWSLASLA
jgi:ribonuclease HI